MRKIVLPLVLAGIFALVASATASAQSCTASLNCNNACSIIDYICSSPYPPCDLSCFAGSQTVSCSGTTSCTVQTSSVTCDNVTKSCPTTSQCFVGGSFIQCGSTRRNCTFNCPV